MHLLIEAEIESCPNFRDTYAVVDNDHDQSHSNGITLLSFTIQMEFTKDCQRNSVRLIDPAPGKYDASDPFGSTKGRSYPHTGSDWFMTGGTPAPAIGTGVVVNKQWHSGNGNTLTVRLPDGHYFAYLHLQSPAIVNVGENVKIGQTLGYVGNTGSNSRGAHLHITVSDSEQAFGGLGNLIDPWAFIQSHLTATDEDVANLVEEIKKMSLFIVWNTTGTGFLMSGVTGDRVALGPGRVTLFQRLLKNSTSEVFNDAELDQMRQEIRTINANALKS
jgi:hypothetical protein